MTTFETKGLNFLAATEKFAAASAVANQIADQNDRLVMVNEDIDDEEFRQLAKEGLALEQEDTLVALKERSDQAPYRELALAWMQVTDDIEALKSEIFGRTREIDREAHRIKALANLTSHLAPYASHNAKRLAEIRVGSLSDATLEELHQQLAEKEHELENLNRLYQIAGRPWQVPQTEHQKDITEPELLEEIIDEIPVEPTPFDFEEQERMRAYAERHVDEPEASRWAAFYLTELQGEVITVDDLISFIYKEDVIERIGRENMRDRITTLLGPKVNGPRMQAMLAEDGLMLQYGWRTVKVLDKESEREVRRSRTRIYRAVPIREFSEEHLEPVTSHTEISATEQQAETISWRSTEELARLVGENLLRQQREEDQLRKIEEAFSQPDQEPTEAPTQVDPTRIIRMEKVPSWVPDFTNQVKHAIKLLAEQDMLSQDPLSQSVMSMKSKSAKMGTNEAIDRLKRAGLIDRHTAKDKIFNARDIVLMHLFNSNRDILTASSKNKQKAVEIIDRQLEIFFREQAANAVES